MLFPIIVVVIVILISLLYKKKTQGVPDNEVTVDIERVFPISKTASFRIAGISHHCDRRDIGVISGELIDDPDNSYDKDAVMIADANKNQLLGYIAKDAKEEYREIAAGKTRMPFVGFIEQAKDDDGRAYLFGIVRTYSGDEDTVMADAQNDWDFLQKAFTVKRYDTRMNLLEQFKWEKH